MAVAQKRSLRAMRTRLATTHRRFKGARRGLDAAKEIENHA